MAGELFKTYGTKALVVTDAATNGRDIVGEVEKSLKEAGISVARFAHITGKSLDITADSAVDEIRKNGSDFIVAIGGNTVMEGAKLIASAAARTLGRAMMPLNFVPTTYHAGACFDASLPDGSYDEALLAKVVLVDPDCMTGMSQKDRAVSGFAALCECIRAYTAPDAQPLTDAMALYAIDILNDKLVGVCGENTDKGAWEKVVLAGVIGSMVSAETGCQVAKDLKQAVAKTSFAADEVLLAAVVPVVVDAKAGRDPFLYGKLARTMGGFTSDDCAARLCYLAKALHLDLRIADMGVHEDDIANLAEAKDILANDKDEEMREMARGEIAELEPKIETLEEEIKLLLIPKDPQDAKNAIVEIRGGTGGDEAAIFAGDLMRMYTKYIESKGWKYEITSFSEGTAGGYKEVVMKVTGNNVYGTLKYESGVHRVQRVPQTETQGRVHTSAASVAALPEAEEFDVEISIDRKSTRLNSSHVKRSRMPSSA